MAVEGSRPGFVSGCAMARPCGGAHGSRPRVPPPFARPRRLLGTALTKLWEGGRDP